MFRAGVARTEPLELSMIFVGEDGADISNLTTSLNFTGIADVKRGIRFRNGLDYFLEDVKTVKFSFDKSTDISLNKI